MITLACVVAGYLAGSMPFGYWIVRLFNYIGDAQNTFPVWNATPLVALDVYEHAYFLDYQTDRAAYIDAFFANLDWDVVNGWIDQYGIPA